MDKQPECYNDSVDLINKISENAHDMSNIMNVAKGIDSDGSNLESVPPSTGCVVDTTSTCSKSGIDDKEQNEPSETDSIVMSYPSTGILPIEQDETMQDEASAVRAASVLMEWPDDRNESNSDCTVGNTELLVSESDDRASLDCQLSPNSDVGIYYTDTSSRAEMPEDGQVVAEEGNKAPTEAFLSAGGSSLSSDPVEKADSSYYVKWVSFNDNKLPIITQNENGPCPLLALLNVLLLRRKIMLPPILEMITSKQLIDQLGSFLVDSKPLKLDAESQADYEQNMQDAMDLMVKLLSGLDVNVKFTGVADFEYTSECIIFDLLQIFLYHGWLVDPQDAQSAQSVGKYSYNQLVERIIRNKESPLEDLVQEALIAEEFLNATASQLTYHGICELSSMVRERELCVFFRNNHFSTMYKSNGELFLLVTDQGFLTENGVVWETLSNVDGNCHFVDADFRSYGKPATAPTAQHSSFRYSCPDDQINAE